METENKENFIQKVLSLKSGDKVYSVHLLKPKDSSLFIGENCIHEIEINEIKIKLVNGKIQDIDIIHNRYDYGDIISFSKVSLENNCINDTIYLTKYEAIVGYQKKVDDFVNQLKDNLKVLLNC